MSELKPCPFCGGLAKPYGFWRHVIRCMKCGTQSAAFRELAEAEDAWNSRALNSMQRHAVELFEALGYVLTQLHLAVLGFSTEPLDANRLQALYDSIAGEVVEDGE